MRLCDHCGKHWSMVYCRSDSATLCLSCDRNVHSANALSRRHTRSLLCDRCSSQPAMVRCQEENASLCQNCDWNGHSAGSSAAGHKRHNMNCYSGCPSSAELSRIWSFILDIPDVAPEPDYEQVISMTSISESAVSNGDNAAADKGVLDMASAAFANDLNNDDDKQKSVMGSSSEADQSSRPHKIQLQYLKEITDNFSDERILGQGGFGVVYKGVLPNGKMIAVKKAVSSLMPGLQKQFESEVYHLTMLKHPNIVRCVGYCYETVNECLEYNGKYVFAEMAERILCLEYLPKGSLDKYLTDESSGLDWSTRYKIIEGICYGLCHLHEQIVKPIIHLDLKPSNILLDDSLEPKVTDFGLSRLLGQQQTICTSSRSGTFGYMAPEFLHGGTVTPKSDTFSLGVIIMEIITGHRDYPGVTGTSTNDFFELTLKKWRNVLARSPGHGSLEMDCRQIKRCMQVGLICVNPDRTKRPLITKVISMIQGSESIDCDTSNEAA